MVGDIKPLWQSLKVSLVFQVAGFVAVADPDALITGAKRVFHREECQQ